MSIYAPEPKNYMVVYWIKDWGYLRSVINAKDGYEASTKVLKGHHAKYPDADVFITEVKQTSQKETP